MTDILGMYEVITQHNVRRGDLVISCSPPNRMSIQAITEVGQSYDDRPTYRTGMSGGMLDNVVVLTQEGKTLIGRNLLESPLSAYP